MYHRRTPRAACGSRKQGRLARRLVTRSIEPTSPWNEGEINMRIFRLRRKSAPGLHYGFQSYPTPTTEVQFSESARRVWMMRKWFKL
eukprot:5576914-Amphidinium_carterae.1